MVNVVCMIVNIVALLGFALAMMGLVIRRFLDKSRIRKATAFNLIFAICMVTTVTGFSMVHAYMNQK